MSSTINGTLLSSQGTDAQETRPPKQPRTPGNPTNLTPQPPQHQTRKPNAIKRKEFRRRPNTRSRQHQNPEETTTLPSPTPVLYRIGNSTRTSPRQPRHPAPNTPDQTSRTKRPFLQPSNQDNRQPPHPGQIDHAPDGMRAPRLTSSGPVGCVRRTVPAGPRVGRQSAVRVSSSRRYDCSARRRTHVLWTVRSSRVPGTSAR